jgi:hypothetical protein
MSDLPATDKMKPTPVYARYLQRKHHMPLDPPSEAEQQDAIRVLAEPDLWIDEISEEAQKILDEAGQ